MCILGFPCPAEPNPPQNGSVACSFGSYQGSVCQFACDRGFKLPSSSPYPVTCMINRQYNGTTPACQRECKVSTDQSLISQYSVERAYVTETDGLGFDSWSGQTED